MIVLCTIVDVARADIEVLVLSSHYTNVFLLLRVLIIIMLFD